MKSVRKPCQLLLKFGFLPRLSRLGGAMNSAREDAEKALFLSSSFMKEESRRTMSPMARQFRHARYARSAALGGGEGAYSTAIEKHEDERGKKIS